MQHDTTHHTESTTAHDVIIIGGGVTGLAAALMLGRARRRVLVIDSGAPRNRFATHMHGVLGHDGLPPLALLEGGLEELTQYDVTVVDGSVGSVTDIARGLQVTRSDGAVEYARSLLVASGVDDELPDIPGLDEHWGTAVFQCPYCHGWEVRDQRIGVLATSPMSVRHALLVRQWTDRLILLTADPALIEGLDEDTRRRLDARDVRVVSSPVTDVVSTDGTFTGLRTADGRFHGLDAVALAPVPHPRDTFLAGLDLDRVEVPGAGPVLRVDETGRTSHPRIWAAGNVVDPRLNVPASTGQASMTAGFLNGDLVEEDTDAALIAASPESGWPDVAEDGYWERNYAGSRTRWSGRPNAALVSILTDVFGDTPDGDRPDPGSRGRAADIGCGEGADAVWLAAHGWDTTGVEVSATAVHRAEQAAEKAGVADLVRFTDAGVLGFREQESRGNHGDHGNRASSGGLDLVTASYLHAPSQDHRESLLHSVGDLVAPDGHFFVLSHILPGQTVPVDPASADESDAELAALGLDSRQWTVVRAETVHRTALAPDGTVVEAPDRALLLRRR